MNPGSDQYVLYARDEGADDDAWVEVGRLDENTAAGSLTRPRWIKDGKNYEYYVMGMDDGEIGDHSNVGHPYRASLRPDVHRAFEKRGGYVIKWKTAEDRPSSLLHELLQDADGSQLAVDGSRRESLPPV